MDIADVKDKDQFNKKLLNMRFPAELNPFEMMIINLMRKREYPKFGNISIFFQNGVPKRFEFVDSTALLEGPQGQEMINQVMGTQKS